MGTDRKGPLVAFVLIAVVAAVLLVTSVRSQAAPGWLKNGVLPAAIVAGPPATDPHLWLSVTATVQQAVEDGVVLMHKSTTDTTDIAGDALVLALSPQPGSQPQTGTGAPAPDGQVGQGPTSPVRHQAHHGPAHQVDHAVGHQETDNSPSRGQQDQGQPGHAAVTPLTSGLASGLVRHHGWSLGHGPGHTAGHAQAHVKVHVKAHGRTQGHRRAHGHGQHRGWARHHG